MMEDHEEALERGEEGETERRELFLELKNLCLELLNLSQNPKRDSSAIPRMLQLLRSSPPSALHPFLDFTLFPLLLLLDAAIDCRSQGKKNREAKLQMYDVPKTPYKVSDKVAEGVIHCLEELLKKCHLGSVDQIVLILKKLTNGAMLTPSEAAEEFREGIIKCFKAMILGLFPCSDQSCICKQSFNLPVLSENLDLHASVSKTFKHNSEPSECLLAFLQSQAASTAVGHWLSILLQVADTEAARGHRGSANLRVEAFITLRVLVAKVGTADALAFFLPGVVSQFAKVLRVSKSMVSGAAGSIEALDQANRGLAEYLMIVLGDDANLSALGISSEVTNSNKYESTHSVLEQLRRLPFKAQVNEVVESSSLIEVTADRAMSNGVNSPGIKGCGSFHVDRTKEWIEKTSSHVNKLLADTFPHICTHPANKVRRGLFAAIRGLLSKCFLSMIGTRLIFLECLCSLTIDDANDVSVAAQEFLQFLFSENAKYHIECDVAEIFNSLIERLPKVVLGSDEALAVSVARQLLVVIYFSGPRFLLDHLQSPITASRFLDVFALCLNQNSTFTGSLEKLVLSRSSSSGYLSSVTELKAGYQAIKGLHTVANVIDPNSKEMPHKNYELPHMPPWFASVGSQKLYETLAGILRLTGLSLMSDCKREGHLSVILDIPLGYIRKLVSEVRVKEYSREGWQSWYNRIGSGQLVRQASTAVCILNEIIYGISDQVAGDLMKMFQISRMKIEDTKQPDEYQNKLLWKISWDQNAKNHLIDCIGKVLHEYQSSELWDLPVDHKHSSGHSDSEFEDITLHFFRDSAMLHQVIIEGIGIFSLCLGKDFVSSGFLHSSLYLLLENLISSNFQARIASDTVFHLLAGASGHSTVGDLVLANADYVIDSICRQLRHLDLNPRVPIILAAMLSYIGVAHQILPLLEEPMRCVSLELEIVGRHQHPNLTIPFLKAVVEIAKASKHEASSLPPQAKSFHELVMSQVSKVMKPRQEKGSDSDDEIDVTRFKPEEWEKIMLDLNHMKRYRQIVGSIILSCLRAATPLLASSRQATCLVALDIVEDGISALANVEEAYRCETNAKEAIEEVLELASLYHLKDTMQATDDASQENRLLPAMNKIWPFLVTCIRNRNPVAVRRCLTVISSVVQVCGGDFFSRRFHTDGSHFWKLLTTSPFQQKPNKKEEKSTLLLPYRTISTSQEDSSAEVSSLKVQASLLTMISDLSRNKTSSSALELVLKKISGLVVGIACSGVVGLRDVALNALNGLACIDPDLVWILLADVYYSLKKKDFPLPPSSDFPEISRVLPPALSSKGFLYVEYGGQSYGFDVDIASVEFVFKKMHSLVFTDQIY